ncbi:MAG: GGDEF domain-containing protein [Lachnospiraceae bacterium]|nr:GGDEF domain-containing protein [Lachnospiraceae bacterium]
MNNRIFKNYVFFTCLFIFLILAIIATLQTHRENVSFYEDTVTDYNDGWSQVVKGIDGSESKVPVKLPDTLYYNDEGTITLEVRLPEHILRGLALGIWVEGQTITATVDGENVYSYGEEYEPMFGKSSGNYYTVIKIPEVANGKNLRVTMTTKQETKSFYMEGVFIGNETALMFNLLGSRGIGLIFSIILCFLGILLGGVYIGFHKLMDSASFERVLFLGFYTLLLASWLFIQSRLYQVFSGNAYMGIMLYYMGFLLLPVPLLYVISYTKGNHFRKILMILAYAFAINSVVSVVLQYANIKDFSESVVSAKILYVIMVVVLLANAIMERKYYKNKEFNYVAIGIYFLAFFGAIELWAYRVQPSHVLGDYLRYGEILMVFMLIYEAAHHLIESIEASRTAAYYEKLAMMDMMANCYSRAAYNHDLEEFVANPRKNLAVILFDLNFLKRINDTLGHQCGDQAIKTCSACIRKIFDRVGKTYRIGGDEFVVFIEKCDEYKLMQRLALFQRLVSEQDKHLEFSFMVASGYAIFDPKQDKTFEDTVKRADLQMYARKRSMKVSMGLDPDER